MAKAVVPLPAWRRREGTTADRSIERRLRDLFADQIVPSGEEADNRS
jgi:hypothetical protein